MALQREDVTLSLLWGSEGSDLWPYKNTGCEQLLELGGTVRVYCNIRVTQDKIPTHPSICGLEHKFSSSLVIGRVVFGAFH